MRKNRVYVYSEYGEAGVKPGTVSMEIGRVNVWGEEDIRHRAALGAEGGEILNAGAMQTQKPSSIHQI